MEGEVIAKLHDAFNAFFSAPCFYGMHRDELADRLACAIPSPALLRNIEGQRRQAATDIVDIVWQARLQDPFAVLPADVGVHLMSFFDKVRSRHHVARMRLVSKEWCKIANKSLATADYFLMRGHKDGGRRQSLVQFVGRRFPSLRWLAADVCGRTGYSTRDIASVLSSCSRVRSFDAFQGKTDDDESAFRFDPLVSIVTTGVFRSIVSLYVELCMSDEEAGAMAGQLPCLQMLSLCWPREDMPPPGKLSSNGVAALINGIPALTALRITCLAHLTQPFPACRSGIRRLSLTNVSLTHEVLHSLLIHIGADLRTLDIGCDELVDASVQCIADRCPQLERLDIGMGQCPLLTPACLPALAQLTKLQELSLDYPGVFTDEHMDWLLQHTRSLALNDYRKRLEEYGDADGVWKACHSFEGMEIGVL